jgi:MFS family permease
MEKSDSTMTGVPAFRSSGYIAYLVVLMSMIALIDWYISTTKTTALPYILQEYNVTASEFSRWEALVLAPTFFIFLLNGLLDIIGRRFSILVLLLLMGLSCLGIVYLAPSFQTFMIFYGIAMFTTVSNMWAVPISEETSAKNRGKLGALVYTIGLFPLTALLAPIIINKWGLGWKWMFGVVFVLMCGALLLWLFMRETRRYKIIQKQRKEGTSKLHVFGIGSIDRSDMKYIVLSAILWLCWLVDSFLFMWMGYYFMTVNDYTLQQWSTVFTGMGLALIVGGVIASLVIDKIGRGTTFVVGCIGMIISLGPLGVVSGQLLPALAVAGGFFISFSYTWFVVYIPEVFPTDRRGACLGWVSTITRISYVLGPLLAAELLILSPKMLWFWVVTGLLMLIPIIVVFVFKPFETTRKELELIEEKR